MQIEEVYRCFDKLHGITHKNLVDWLKVELLPSPPFVSIVLHLAWTEVFSSNVRDVGRGYNVVNLPLPTRNLKNTNF